MPPSSRPSYASKRPSFRSHSSSFEADDERSTSDDYAHSYYDADDDDADDDDDGDRDGGGTMSPGDDDDGRPLNGHAGAGAGFLPPRFPGEDTRPTSSKELAGWYMYAFAAETYVVCGQYIHLSYIWLWLSIRG